MADPHNLRTAVHKSYTAKSQRQRSKKEVQSVMHNLDEFVKTNNQSIKKGTYKVGQYRHFKLTEKKERNISVLPYRDRCVQNQLKDAIEPVLLRRMTSDMCAGLPGRGVMSNDHCHSVVHKVHRILQKPSIQWYWQGDIRKFYDNVDNIIAMKSIERVIHDKKTLALIRQFLFNQESLAIGDPMSHLIANSVISDLVRYMKEVVKVPYLVNFADDFLIFAETKGQAREYGRLARRYASSHLRLHFKDSSQVHNIEKETINFCGRVYTRNKTLISKRTKKRYIKARHSKKSMAAYNGILESCNCQNLRKKVEQFNNSPDMNKTRTPFAGKPMKIDQLIGQKQTIVNLQLRDSKQRNTSSYYDVQAIVQGFGLVRYTTSSKNIVSILSTEPLPIRDVVIQKDWIGFFFDGSVYTDAEEADIIRKEFGISY